MDTSHAGPGGDTYYAVYQPTDCGSGDLLHEVPGLSILLGNGKQFLIYNALARRLATHGIAVAVTVPEDVSGAPGPDLVTRRAESGVAGLLELSNLPEVDATRLGLYGHSQGAEATLTASNLYPNFPGVTAIAFAAPTAFLDEAPTGGALSLFGIQGTADEDVIVGGGHSVPGNGSLDPIAGALSTMGESMEEVSNDPRLYVTKLLYGANHDAVVTEPEAQALTVSFMRRALLGDFGQQAYLANDALPPSVSQSFEVYTQYRSSARRVIDNLETGTIFESSIGGSVWGTMSFGAVVWAQQLANNAHYDTKLLYFKPAVSGEYIAWTIPNGQSNVSSYDNLSFAVGQNYYLDDDVGPVNFWVWIRDDNGYYVVDSAAYATVPAPDEAVVPCANGQCNISFAHMRTVRIPLQDFVAQGLDIQNVREVFIQTPEPTVLNDNAYFLDNLEFAD